LADALGDERSGVGPGGPLRGAAHGRALRRLAQQPIG
jgi:hypothetical protein